MQDRLGPNRANIAAVRSSCKGILHFVADALKMIFKEDFVPGEGPQGPVHAGADPGARAGADRRRDHPVRPAAVLGPADRDRSPTASAAARRSIRCRSRGSTSACSSTSRSRRWRTTAPRWPAGPLQQVGAARRPARLVADDVVRGRDGPGADRRVPRLGTLEPGAIVGTADRGVLAVELGSSWGIFLQPLGFILFLTAAIAETKRAPFDIPEGEPEIIGYFVEYSGMRLGMFFLAEFIEIVSSSAIMVTLFFGGWHFPRGWRRGWPRTCRTSLFVLLMFGCGR